MTVWLCVCMSCSSAEQSMVLAMAKFDCQGIHELMKSILCPMYKCKCVWTYTLYSEALLVLYNEVLLVML